MPQIAARSLNRSAFILLSLCIALPPVMARARCAPPATASREVVATIEQMFAAARADDLPALLAITTPNFYAYDGGRRFTAQSLMALIQKAHADGKHYEWSVTDPDVHVSCALAWITYVNKGFIEDGSGRQDMTWLESGVLEYADHRWKTRFFHSTREPKSP
jgi:hypothetical protein